MAFDRDAIRSFRFVDCGFDAGSGVARLVYAFDDGPELVETITIPGAPFAFDGARAVAVEHATRLLHLIAGVSYYKAAVPETIRIDGYAIDGDTAALLDDIYLHGLGEFAYRNGLDLRGRIRFPATVASLLPPAGEEPAPEVPLVGGARRADEGSTPAAPAAGLHQHALVAIGGGKDSLVSIEALRDAGVAQTVSWIGGSQLIRACAERTGLPTLNIQRQLAPQLFDYNREGAYNGHIPVTAINSAILALAALVLDADQVVFSNERSASYGSLIEGSGEVNHQWSKGWAFEQAFGHHLQHFVAADLRYYSLLRPLSELAVARQFARIDRYDAHFSSCNRNFHLLGERPVNRWCGVCPKCHFVFLALAPFMPKPRLVAIFGRNLLDDASQVPGYDALIEYRDHKPFECVGEARESRAALAALAARPEWREDAIVARFAREIAPQLGGAGLDVAQLLDVDGEHRIPAALWERLRARFAA
ncbi:endonuclease domain-containing protein [Luteimonas yindakuii]|uniref:UDP-N-acetyl-alpha-D-muramoyl-L-alanyl-L-glutamate epimerase n=1 Tax=Luteimonas yindakuii TaxID=2565782 RepID=A0A4Z1R6Y6_9GAMM|nr:UDP-N-acetyl-alpha-D-muramoyl-L-alanyl-L-glutamate epimerase [Luteimonas yindakuii]TKS55220.1 endonuclease domain-containing protein [Luteimonas yindakuii]